MTQGGRAGTHDFLTAEAANHSRTMKMTRVGSNLIAQHCSELLICTVLSNSYVFHHKLNMCNGDLITHPKHRSGSGCHRCGPCEGQVNLAPLVPHPAALWIKHKWSQTINQVSVVITVLYVKYKLRSFYFRITVFLLQYFVKIPSTTE